jgi:hypothetical protein
MTNEFYLRLEEQSMNDMTTLPETAATMAPGDGAPERANKAPKKGLRPDRGLRKLAEMHQWRRAAFIEAAMSLRLVTAEQVSQNAEIAAERIRAIQGGRRIGSLPAHELAAVQEWKALRAMWIAVSEALANHPNE